MQESSFSISNKLLNAIVKIESIKTALEVAPPVYNVRSKLTQRSKALNLFHLSHMLGMGLTLRDAERLAEGRKLELPADKLSVLNNFRNVLEYNRAGLNEQVTDIGFSLLLHLNKIVLTDWRETWDVRFRAEGDKLDTADDWFSFRDINYQLANIENDLRELFEWFMTDGSKINRVIAIGIVIYRLVEIMPFAAGNKLTILALGDYLLFQAGYADRTYLPVVRNFDIHMDEYAEGWSYAKRNQDITLWIERFALAMAKDLQENKVEVDQYLAEEEKGTKQPFLELNKRQLKVLRYLQTIPTLGREDYCQMMDVSTMTAFRDLNDLVRKKMLKIEGRGRATKYMLSNR